MPVYHRTIYAILAYAHYFTFTQAKIFQFETSASVFLYSLQFIVFFSSRQKHSKLWSFLLSFKQQANLPRVLGVTAPLSPGSVR